MPGFNYSILNHPEWTIRTTTKSNSFKFYHCNLLILSIFFLSASSFPFTISFSSTSSTILLNKAEVHRCPGSLVVPHSLTHDPKCSQFILSLPSKRGLCIHCNTCIKSLWIIDILTIHGRWTIYLMLKIHNDYKITTEDRILHQDHNTEDRLLKYIRNKSTSVTWDCAVASEIRTFRTIYILQKIGLLKISWTESYFSLPI